MVQYNETRLDASFAALSDATRRGVLEQLSRADASITDLAGKFHMTLTGKGSRSRRGPEFVGHPKQLAMAVGHAKAMENRRG